MFFFVIFYTMILKKEITIIGSGAVAKALAVNLKRKHFSVTIIGRTKKKITNLALTVSGKAYLFNEAEEKQFQNLTVIAVKDDAVADVVQIIWRSCRSLNGAVFFHVSGGLTSSLLQPLAMLGAETASFHPMQTFPKRAMQKNPFSGITISLEGNRKAVQTGKLLAEILGAKTIVLSSEKKALYHTAGIFASNYLVTLLSIVREIAVEAGIPQKKVWEVYLPLMQTTLMNASAITLEKALTGPISRGDVKTVQKHLQALSKKKLRHLVPLYAALGIETVRLAKKKTHAR